MLASPVGLSEVTRWAYRVSGEGPIDEGFGRRGRLFDWFHLRPRVNYGTCWPISTFVGVRVKGPNTSQIGAMPHLAPLVSMYASLRLPPPGWPWGSPGGKRKPYAESGLLATDVIVGHSRRVRHRPFVQMCLSLTHGQFVLTRATAPSSRGLQPALGDAVLGVGSILGARRASVRCKIVWATQCLSVRPVKPGRPSLLVPTFT